MLIGSIGSVILFNKAQLVAISFAPGAVEKIGALIALSRCTTTAVAIQFSGAFFGLSPVFSFALIAVLWIGGFLLLGGVLIYRYSRFKASILS